MNWKQEVKQDLETLREIRSRAEERRGQIQAATQETLDALQAKAKAAKDQANEAKRVYDSIMSGTGAMIEGIQVDSPSEEEGAAEE